MKTEQCPSQRELIRFDRGESSTVRGKEISDHLEQCRDCSTVLDSLEGGVDVVIANLRQKLPAEILEEDSEIHRLVGMAEAIHDTHTADSAETEDGSAAKYKPSTDDIATQILSPAEAEDEIGRLEGYRVLEVLGMGGMGVVFKAEDLELKRLVAIKAMLPHVAAASTSTCRRFLREAQATAAVHHDNIVTIHQVSQRGDVPFLVMHLLEGESLGSRLAREGKLPIDEACRIARDTAEGLHAAHGKGLTHRDIKPDNIWLESVGKALPDSQSVSRSAGSANTPSGRPELTRVKILDFGLAHVNDSELDLTQTGVVVGTPSYLAPEQVRGLAVDARADLFSLGVVLYLMLTGKRPFHRGSTVATLRAIDSETPPTPASVRHDIPHELSDLVMKLLEKETDQRVQSSLEFIDALRRIEQKREATRQMPVVEVSPEAGGNSRRPRFPRSIILASAAASFLLLLGVILIIKDKDGGIIARIFAPKGASVEIESEDDRVDNVNVGDNVDVVSVGDRVNPPNAREADDRRADSDGQQQLLPPTERPPLNDDEAEPPSPAKVAFVQRPGKLAASDGEEIKHWTVVSREPIRWGHETRMASLRGDGKLLATFGGDGYVRVWDVMTNELRHVLIGHDAGSCLSWHAGQRWMYERATTQWYGPIMWAPGDVGDGAGAMREGVEGNRYLATASRDGSLRVWDTDNGKEIVNKPGPVDGISMLAWSPNGNLLAAAYATGDVRCWRTSEKWEELPKLSELDSPALAMAWSPDSQSLAIYDRPHFGKIHVWKPVESETYSIAEPAVIADVQRGYPPMRWSQDGSLAFASQQGVKVCETKTWSVEKTIRNESNENDPAKFVAWSPDGRRLLVGWPNDCAVHATDTGAVERRIQHSPGFPYAAWSPDGRSLTIGGKLVRLDNEEPLPQENAFDNVHSWSDDSKLLLATDGNISSCVYRSGLQDATPEKLFVEVIGGAGVSNTGISSPWTWSPGDRAMAYTAGNTFLIDWTETVNEKSFRAFPTAIQRWTNNGKIAVKWDASSGVKTVFECRSTEDGKLASQFEIPDQIYGVDLSPDGTSVACGGAKGQLLIVDIVSGEIQRDWNISGANEGGSPTIVSVGFSHDGQRIATEVGGSCLVISVKDGMQLVKIDDLPAWGNHSNRISWSPDDAMILAPGPRELFVYRADTGAYATSFAIESANFFGNPGTPLHFEDSRTALCGTSDGNVYRLNVESGEQSKVAEDVGQVVQFSSDAKYIAVNEGAVRRIKSLLSGKLVVSIFNVGNTLFFVSPEGHFWTPETPPPRGAFWYESLRVAESLLYVVQTTAGQTTLTPKQFADRYEWRNDPAKVRLK